MEWPARVFTCKHGNTHSTMKGKDLLWVNWLPIRHHIWMSSFYSLNDRNDGICTAPHNICIIKLCQFWQSVVFLFVTFVGTPSTLCDVTKGSADPCEWSQKHIQPPPSESISYTCTGKRKKSLTLAEPFLILPVTVTSLKPDLCRSFLSPVFSLVLLVVLVLTKLSQGNIHVSLVGIHQGQQKHIICGNMGGSTSLWICMSKEETLFLVQSTFPSI